MTRGRIRRSTARAAAGLVLLSTLGTGCYAGLPGEGDANTAGDDQGEDPSDDVMAQCQGDPSPGATPLRRLTSFEYDNTVADLLGDDSRPSSAFVSDAAAGGFDTHAATQPLSQLQAEHYMDAAEALAATAVVDRDALLNCDLLDVGFDACAERFIDDFGRRAFRRPLTDEERDAWWGLYTEANAAHGYTEAIELLVQAFLQAPSFLYRVELGTTPAGPELTEGSAVRLSDYEMASRLSYLLWASMPDDALLDQAEAGQLGTPEELEAQARRMLDDPRARRAVTEFHAQWLRLHEVEHVTKDPVAYPEYDEQIRAWSARQTRMFVEHVVFDGEGDLGTLLTADYGYLNEPLAEFYGVDTDVVGDTLRRVQLDPERRAGLLTQASLLSVLGKPDQSSPVLRGAFVRDAFLCQPLPAPPPDVDTTLPDIEPGVSTRERLSRHSEDPACAGCHTLIDPVGFGLEHYDGVGRWRDQDQGLEIDASGELLGTDDIDGAFDGAVQLAHALASSEQVQGCFVRQWFRFAQARAETDDDACSLAVLDEAFVNSEQNIVELLVAQTQTDAFAYRPAIAAVGD